MIPRRALGGALFLLIAASSWAWYMQARRIARDPALALSVASEHLFLGEVWAQNRVPCVLPIQNNSRDFISILRFRTSCRCVSLDPPSMTVAPGEIAQLRLDLDLADRAFETKGIRVRVVPVVENASFVGQHKGWAVSGSVRMPIHCSSEMFDFGEISILDHARRTVCVGIRAVEPLQVMSATTQVENARVGFRHIVGNEYEVSADIEPLYVDGEFDFDVDIAFGQDGRTLGVFPIRARGRYINEVEAIPEVVSFGAIEVGSVEEAQVVVRSRSGHPFSASVEVDSAIAQDVKISPVSTSTKKEHAFRIVLTVTRSGSFASEAIFRIQLENRSVPIEVVLPIQYHGA